VVDKDCEPDVLGREPTAPTLPDPLPFAASPCKGEPAAPTPELLLLLLEVLPNAKEVLLVVLLRPPASNLGVTSPPRPGIIGVAFREVADMLLLLLLAAPAKGNLLSYVETEAEEVAGRLPPVANEPQLV